MYIRALADWIADKTTSSQKMERNHITFTFIASSGLKKHCLLNEILHYCKMLSLEEKSVKAKESYFLATVNTFLSVLGCRQKIRLVTVYFLLTAPSWIVYCTQYCTHCTALCCTAMHCTVLVALCWLHCAGCTVLVAVAGQWDVRLCWCWKADWHRDSITTLDTRH